MSIISNAINFSPLGDNRLMPLEGWKQPSQNSYPGPGTLLEAWNNCHLNFDFHNLVEQVIRNSKFELWCWKRLLRVPWIARRSNQSFLKEINPEYSLEGLMLKLKLEYFGHLMWRADSLEKTLMLEKIEDRKRRDDKRWDGWMESLIQWTWIWASSGRWWRTGKPGMLQSMGVAKSWMWLERLNNINNNNEYRIKSEGKVLLSRYDMLGCS